MFLGLKLESEAITRWCLGWWDQVQEDDRGKWRHPTTLSKAATTEEWKGVKSIIGQVKFKFKFYMPVECVAISLCIR